MKLILLHVSLSIIRGVLVHIILPIIMLCISVLGIVFPEYVNKSKWISKPFNFKTLNKNDDTVRVATRSNCICLLVEGILYSFLSIMVLCNKVTITSLENFLLIILMIIIPLPIMFIVHFIIFDKNGHLRRNK